jgi:uncharacterized protein
VNRLLTVLALAAVVLLSSATPGRAEPQFGAPAALVVDGASTYDFRSGVTGRDYRLFVWAPDDPAPPEGYPVFYVLDGNSHFYVALSAARAQSMFNEIRSAIVVGVGYPLDDQAEILRTRNKDLTTPIAAEALARMPPNPGLTIENTGGLDDFLAMLEIEVKPFIASTHRVNPADQTLFGHSLGGLAVVRALFTRPNAYRTFASSSPSLFWNDRAVLKGEAELSAQVRSGTASPRVLLTAGALEGSRSGYRTGGVPMTQDQVNALIESTRMVDNAADLGARLEHLKGSAPYRARTVIFADESHLSVMPAAISRALQFALSVDGDGLPARADPE